MFCMETALKLLFWSFLVRLPGLCANRYAAACFVTYAPS